MTNWGVALSGLATVAASVLTSFCWTGGAALEILAFVAGASQKAKKPAPERRASRREAAAGMEKASPRRRLLRIARWAGSS